MNRKQKRRLKRKHRRWWTELREKKKIEAVEEGLLAADADRVVFQINQNSAQPFRLPPHDATKYARYYVK